MPGGWRLEGVRNVLKVSELNNRVKERAHQVSLRGKYDVSRSGGGSRVWRSGKS